jgi:hypothetical protein
LLDHDSFAEFDMFVEHPLFRPAGKTSVVADIILRIAKNPAAIFLLAGNSAFIADRF